MYWKMIIDDKINGQDKCTGCRVCITVCPVNAIVSKKGSRLEAIYEIGENCIHCGRCKSVCPIDKDFYYPKANSFYRLSSKDGLIRLKSSSGGAAYHLSAAIIKTGGVVYVAGWNVEKQRVEHMRVANLDQLSSIQGSKYVQSWISEETYISIQQDLEKSPVLFTGTPCQVAAVRSYTKDNKNLISIDLICHGVPSPDFLTEQLQAITKNRVENISFRNGLDFSLRLSTANMNFCENGYDNPYYSLFLNFASLREYCYNCKYACSQRVGDITVGDFEEDKKGYSCVVVNSEKGNNLFLSCLEYVDSKPYSISKLLVNHAFNKPTVKHVKTDKFTKLYKRDGLIKAYNKCFRTLRVKRKIKLIVGETVYNKIKAAIRRQ